MGLFSFLLTLIFEHAGRSASGIGINLIYSQLPVTWRLCKDEPYNFMSISILSLL
jgi:hypothetical protein